MQARHVDDLLHDLHGGEATAFGRQVAEVLAVTADKLVVFELHGAAFGFDDAHDGAGKFGFAGALGAHNAEDAPRGRFDGNGVKPQSALRLHSDGRQFEHRVSFPLRTFAA